MKKIPLLLFLSSLAFSMSGCNLIRLSDTSTNNKLVVLTPPFKNSYTVGEMFSSIGLVVTDQDNNEINNYKLSLRENYVFTTYDVGDYKVDITLEDYESTSFTVNVKDKENQDALSIEKTRYINELTSYYDSLNLDL